MYSVRLSARLGPNATARTSGILPLMPSSAEPAAFTCSGVAEAVQRKRTTWWITLESAVVSRES